MTITMLACGAPGSSASAAETTRQAASLDSAATREDSLLVAARALLRSGRPWAAYQELAPALEDSSSRTPSVVLLAARAAASWGGWSHAESLLSDQSWLDEEAGGAGWLILADAALARDADTLARERASRAVARAPDEHTRAERLVRLARAYDRLDQIDSASAAYLSAAAALPKAGDWLLLRAAEATADARARHAIYARVRDPLARSRVEESEAYARERTKDFSGAAEAYARLGDDASALRARATAAFEAGASRDSLRAALDAELHTRRGGNVAGAAADLLDEWFSPLSATEELAIARIAAPARAARGYAAAVKGGARLTSADHYDYARALQQLGRNTDAAREYARVSSPASLRASAQYQRARSELSRGRLPTSRAILRQLLRDYPRAPESGLALFLLADLATDEGRDQAAREAYVEAAERFPQMSRAARSRFLGAVIAYVQGSKRVAAREWDSVVAQGPAGDEWSASIYWAGRAYSELGDSAAAASRWHKLVEQQPTSYFATDARRRLGLEPWAPGGSLTAPDDSAASVLSGMLATAELLEDLGLHAEARRVENAVADSAGERASLTSAAVAGVFTDAERPWRAIPLASRALSSRKDPDAWLYRQLYPAPHLNVIVEQSRKNGIDPALLAALIRQESWFNPKATSTADARGYAQVLPRVGREVARELDFPHWDSGMLYEPEASIALGARHLANSLARYDDVALALAAYNAGQSRVERWRKKGGAHDVDVFIERIPFEETRNYVRIVLRNRELYRALYPELRR